MQSQYTCIYHQVNLSPIVREKNLKENVTIQQHSPQINAIFCFKTRSNWLRHDTTCYFNVQSKADISQLNLPHRTNNKKVGKQKN